MATTTNQKKPKARGCSDLAHASVAAADVIGLLCQLGLLDEDTLVEQGAEVREVTRRNANFTVQIDDGGVFVKTPRDQIARSTLAHEHDMLHRLSATPYPKVPRPLAKDEVSGALVMEYFPNYLPLKTHVLTKGNAPLRWANRAGRALAQLHGRTVGGVPEAMEMPVFRWLYPDAAEVVQATSAVQDLQRRLQNDAGCHPCIATLRTSSRPTCWVHGDLRLENVIVAEDSDFPILVDWEFAGAGDPARDLGTLLGSFLSLGLMPPPYRTEVSAERLARAALAGYCAGRGQVSPEFSLIAIQFMGLFLLQLAFERASNTHALDGGVGRLGDLGYRCLTAPHLAYHIIHG